MTLGQPQMPPQSVGSDEPKGQQPRRALSVPGVPSQPRGLLRCTDSACRHLCPQGPPHPGLHGSKSSLGGEPAATPLWSQGPTPHQLPPRPPGPLPRCSFQKNIPNSYLTVYLVLQRKMGHCIGRHRRAPLSASPPRPTPPVPRPVPSKLPPTSQPRPSCRQRADGVLGHGPGLPRPPWGPGAAGGPVRATPSPSAVVVLTEEPAFALGLGRVGRTLSPSWVT